MTREELIAAKNELTADTEIPRKEKGQLMAKLDNQLASLKRPIQQKHGGFFYSFMSEGETISTISRLEAGAFIVYAEPDALISVYPLSAEQYLEMQKKKWPEVV
jgi:hypothetical protein